jgi:hypothetical protein
MNGMNRAEVQLKSERASINMTIGKSLYGVDLKWHLRGGEYLVGSYGLKQILI